MSDEQPSTSAAALRFGAADEAARTKVRFVTVQRCDSVIEAEVVKSKLEAEGLSVRLSDANVASVAPHLASSMGGVGVLVSDDDAERASALIQDLGTDVTAGTRVFRVLAHQGTLYAAAGALAGGAVTFTGLVLGWVEPWLTMVLPVGLGLGAFRYGQSKSRDYCSRLGCAQILPADATVCPGCQGRIAGTLKNASDRLGAEEAFRGELEDADSKASL